MKELNTEATFGREKWSRLGGDASHGEATVISKSVVGVGMPAVREIDCMPAARERVCMPAAQEGSGVEPQLQMGSDVVNGRSVEEVRSGNSHPTPNSTPKADSVFNTNV